MENSAYRHTLDIPMSRIPDSLPINHESILAEIEGVMYRSFSKHFIFSINPLFRPMTIKVIDKSNVMEYLNKHNLDMEKHLEDDVRWKWFNNETSSNYKNKQIFVICHNDKEIIFTVSYTQYLVEHLDVYQDYVDKYLKCDMNNCIIIRTLVVNPDYRRLGISKLIMSSSAFYWLRQYYAIIGSTNNSVMVKAAFKTYKHVIYDKEEDYWYFHNTD